MEQTLENAGQDQQRKKTEHNRRDTGQQFDGGFDDFANARAGELRNVNRRPNAEWHREQQCHQRRLEAPDKKRNDIILGNIADRLPDIFRLVVADPLPGAEEPAPTGGINSRIGSDILLEFFGFEVDEGPDCLGIIALQIGGGNSEVFR